MTVPFVDRDFDCIPNCKMAAQNGECLTRCIIKRSKPPRSTLSVTDEMVDRFLGWTLPDSVCSDTCATVRDYGKAEGWPPRSGTSLLTADEARQMLEHVLAARPEVGAIAALQELVRLKDIKDRLDYLESPCTHPNALPTLLAHEAYNLNADYKANKPKAWAAARAVLSASSPQKE